MSPMGYVRQLLTTTDTPSDVANVLLNLASRFTEEVDNPQEFLRDQILRINPHRSVHRRALRLLGYSNPVFTPGVEVKQAEPLGEAIGEAT